VSLAFIKVGLLLNQVNLYDIILPPKAENTSSNPYFRPKLVHLGVKNVNPESANSLIDNFIVNINMEMSQNMNQIFTGVHWRQQKL
jgi:hypothetical protein